MRMSVLCAVILLVGATTPSAQLKLPPPGTSLDLTVAEREAIIKAYRLYLEHCTTNRLEIVLSVTRAWRLVKFIDASMLRTVPCTKCRGHFVMRTDDLAERFVCGLCHIPSRAGKTKAARSQPVQPVLSLVH